MNRTMAVNSHSANSGTKVGQVDSSFGQVTVISYLSDGQVAGKQSVEPRLLLCVFQM